MSKTTPSRTRAGNLSYIVDVMLGRDGRGKFEQQADPPRVAVWLIALFAPGEAAESIVGDLSEEFADLVAQSGAASALTWYWRQTWRTITHLWAAGFSDAPWATAGAVLLGYLLVTFGIRWPLEVAPAILNRYRVYETHPEAYLLWFTWGGQIERVVLYGLAGATMALAEKGREMTATITLGFAETVLAITGYLYVVVRTGHYWILGTLPWVLACSLAIVIGGAIVRSRRCSARLLHE